jgi:hypothetical protein
MQGSTGRLSAFILCLLCSAALERAWSIAWKADFAVDGSMWPFQRLVEDREGNIYVIGRAYLAGKGHAAIIVKYLRNGHLAWSRTYQTATNAADTVDRLVIDRRGDLSAIITTFTPEGSSASVVKLDSDGNFLSAWQRPYLLTAAAGDLDGNIFMSGFLRTSNAFDHVLAKYDPNGLEVWEHHSAFPAPEQGPAYALAIDPDGNIYATGSQISILKFDRDGHNLWMANYFGRYAVGMVLDKDQNVYVIGFRGVGEDDTLTVKLDSNGRELWQSAYRDSRASLTTPLDIAVNDQGEVYIVTTPYYLGYRVVKYSAFGQLLWENEEPGQPFWGQARLLVDQQGDVWLWTTTWSRLFNDDAVMVHYNSEGHRLQVHRYEPPPRGLEWAADMLVARSGQIVLTYYSIDKDASAWITRMLPK